MDLYFHYLNTDFYNTDYWRRNLAKDYNFTHHPGNSSPIVSGVLVCICAVIAITIVICGACKAWSIHKRINVTRRKHVRSREE